MSTQRLVRCVALAGVALAVLGQLFSGGPAALAQTCPNQDFTVDYNCPLGPTYLIPGLTDLNGWNQPFHYQTILAGDIDGDGQDELVARGAWEIEVYRFNKTLGQWTRVLLNPIIFTPDFGDWTAPDHYQTLRLGDVDGDGQKDLAFRLGLNVGVQVYTFKAGATPDTLTVTQLASSGPMGDTACFANGKCWLDDASYYSTIQLVDIDGSGKAALVGRGGDGLEAYQWNGSGWTQLTGLPALSDANGWTQPQYYQTLQYAKMAASLPGAQLVARFADGLHVYRYVSASAGGGTGGSWIDLTPNNGGVFNDATGWTAPQNYRTLQPAQLDQQTGQQTGVKSFVIGRAPTGLSVVQFVADSLTQGHYVVLVDATGPFPDADGWDQPDQYLTIQPAAIDGTASPQAVLGRSAQGIVAYRFDAATSTWSGPIAPSQPALADDPWATDPSYYTTIKTANVDGNADGQVALLARGAWGLRTWRFDATTQMWTRYLPYGSYPAVDSTAFTALNTFLGIENGTIRTVYTDPTNPPTAEQLQGYQNDIAQTFTGLLSGDPPQYQSCTPPSDANPVPTQAAWTTVSNQIIAELYGAGQVIDHFTTLGTINSQLFTNENSEFPAIAADLKLGDETQNTVAQVDYLGLFGSVLSFLATLFQAIPDFEAVGTVLDITAGAMGIAQAATPTLSGSQPSQFDQTYAQIQQQIATIQQQTQDALTFHQSYVLGDYGLLSTVGHLVGSQIWTLDPEGALSLHRQAFTAWVYQAFLPALWDRWTVEPLGIGRGCFWDGGPACIPPGSSADTWVSTAPDGGLGMVSWQPQDNGDGTTTTSFDGLLPKQTPCSVNTSEPLNWLTQCSFQDLTDHGYADTLTYLRTAPPATCVYNPGHTAWEYGTCPLGVDLNDVVQWGFSHITCAYEGAQMGWPGCDSGTPCSDQYSCYSLQSSPVALGEAQGVGSDKGRVDLTLQVPLEDDLDLRQARVTLGRLIREVGGAEELVSDRGGEDVSPRTLAVRPGAKRHKATFKTPGREVPQIHGTLAIDNGQLTVEVHIDRATLDLPQRCDRTTFKTHLHTHLVIDDGQHRPAQVHSAAPWQCVTDPDGDVHRLQWSPEPASR